LNHHFAGGALSAVYRSQLDGNNPLAVELERENDRVSRRFFRQTYPSASLVSDFTSLGAMAPMRQR
jgi:hypothetical protein